ncbi:hypothetical protein B0G81_8136 [Paraburkholderia sp. BL6665CI2N2]|uniref:hypothetical protein n=1 Tax=Paraburkholderia sp. BL6665CI2N2 TaxID=1938806 RepID=UPI001066D2BD|nr:hypothetical protein [Paraburkholderia sp. BL6665CI2N2]TDY16980.1 hypothetical protein B0G81_8136 [Paraburkholderia sp. BL6665CI2N2]
MADRPFVLRSVHFPPDMDESLCQLAFELNQPKAAIIRIFVRCGLDALKREAGSGRRKTEQFFRHYATRSVCAAKTTNESSRVEDLVHGRGVIGRAQRPKNEPKELQPNMPALYSGFYPDLKYRPTSSGESPIPIVRSSSEPVEVAISAAGIALHSGNTQLALDFISLSVKHGASELYGRKALNVLRLMAESEHHSSHHDEAQALEREINAALKALEGNDSSG